MLLWSQSVGLGGNNISVVFKQSNARPGMKPPSSLSEDVIMCCLVRATAHFGSGDRY
jgi:hypothetical protein